VAAAAALALPPAASAHAVLLGTKPSNDAVLPSAPALVTLRFNEPVEIQFGSLRVYNAAAHRVDTGSIRRPDDRSVAVPLRPHLSKGTYTVTWRVVSADSHPVQGAFVFHIGAPGANPAGIAAEVRNRGAPQWIVTFGDGLRGIQFALLLLCAGGAFALLWTLRSAGARVRARLYAALAGAAGALAAAAITGIVVQGAIAGGFGFSQALRWDAVSAVLQTRYGHAWALAALGALTLVSVAVWATDGSRTAGVVAFAIAAACACVPTFVGHAHVTGLAATVADLAHVQAAAIWTGGLATVVAALALERRSRWRVASTAVPAFSRTAVVSVAVLIVAGTLSGFLEVRALRGLWETHYGQLLLVKLALVVPLLAVGAINNRLSVPRLRSELASPQERRSFVTRAGVELALMVAVVSVTAVLVAEPPARASVAPTGPAAVDTTVGPYELNLVADPAVAGLNTIHVYLLNAAGRPADVAAVEVAASLPSRRIGPLRFDAHPLAPGHFAVHGAQLALPGDWQLRVGVRRGEFDLYERTVSIPIRKGRQ
jgi:copper transport protein